MNIYRNLPALVALFAGIVAAQDYRARVQGAVMDPSGAIVAGAKVTLNNVNTGVQTVRQTGENGRYLFDFVEPGMYSVTVEQPGFGTFVQKDIRIQVRADITVDAVLRVGTLSEEVVVEASAVALQFNTSTMEMTIDNKMLSDLPIAARNPFTLALLNPAVVNRESEERNPFNMWAASQMDVGGSTATKNDLYLDGAPIQLGLKASYAPPMDAVQEFSVQQNSVDAEFGHSAGGVMSVGMKSGTNEFHGTAYYLGRNPKLNAVTNSVTHTPNLLRSHMWGVTLGNPIKKNKVFSFFAYEQWRLTTPATFAATMPTALEQTGDFSQTRTTTGALRTIYDPFSSVYNSSLGKWSRQPFAGNVIPVDRINATAKIFLKDFWTPNGPGDNLAGANNYRASYGDATNYRNISERVDWNLGDNWKVYGRYSQFRTHIVTPNYSPNNSRAFNPYSSGIMHSRNVAADSVYTLNATTVLNFRYSYSNLMDDFADPRYEIGEEGLAELWPNNPWYKLYSQDTNRIYYPDLNFSGYVQLGRWVTWQQHPVSHNASARLSRSQGRHYLKTGFETRYFRGEAGRPDLMMLNFAPDMTADTYPSPNTQVSGSPFATFLLGALDSGSYAYLRPLQRPRYTSLAGYFQDDLKWSQRLTLNLGLRWEFQTGPRDPNAQLVRTLDLSQPLPALQALQLKMPDAANALRQSAPAWNGAWIYTTPGQRMYNAELSLSPRFGFAYRLDHRSVVRVGYARYIIPPVKNGTRDASDSLGRLPYDGYSADSRPLAVLEGIPQASLSSPFTAQNPLTPALGTSLGIYSRVGTTATFYPTDFHVGVNDRFNISYQRELPGQIHADVTYFFNLGHNHPYSKNLNMADPNIAYTYKAATTQSVDNPFYGVLDTKLFPGSLRNTQRVAVSTLLTPYPHYSSITQASTPGVRTRYQALQISVRRPFARGLMYTVAYNFNHDKQELFFDNLAEYAQRFTWIPNTNPRHRMSVGYNWELPFGKGRRLLNTVHPVVHAVLGGWSTSGIFSYNSGVLLSFGQMTVNGNPKLENPTRARWFDTSVFSVAPAYTPRSNPWVYEDLAGPRNWNLDSTLSKEFSITEGLRLEFRMEAYNMTNSFIPSNPIVAITNVSFGRCTSQGNQGRTFQYNVRLKF